MVQQKTKELIKNVLENSFNLDKFKLFINNLLNRADFSKSQKISPEEIGSEFKDHIKSCQFLGEYTDKNEKKIHILIVQFNNEGSIERARTLQRNFIAKYLKYNPGVNSSLVAFFQEDSPDWRFSFVKLDSSLNEKGNLRYDFTPVRRYSFLVGKNEFSHTAQSQLAPILENEGDIYISGIEECFQVEKVTKEFFEEYKKLFDELYKEIKNLKEKDKLIKEEFESKNVAEEDFAKKILSQIVFLYFLQKKGWLGIKRNSITKKFGNFGEGNKRFMSDFFRIAMERNKNFFNDYLEYLFYDALAKSDRKMEDYSFELDGNEWKIPFLNGGLFEPLGEYDWKRTDVKINNNIFKKIFEIFDRYNFTVREDEPMEKEVAIDPEMLGKVFENLLESKERKSTGSFYTPREIVHYMCQQSLINYLETNLPIKRDIIEKFVNENNSQNIPKEIIENKFRINNLLRDIKVVDPAVGSGAFLVGMMTEIIRVRSCLDKDKKIFDLKEECIENNLHGVDISPDAVDICQLRLWLSLIVDEEDYGNVKPLPNLDYKIMCGNSLIEEFDGMKLWDDKWLGIKKQEPSRNEQIKSIDIKINKLKSKIPYLFNQKEEKIKLEKEIKKLEKEKIVLSKGRGENMKLDYSDSERKLIILKKYHEEFTRISDRMKKREQKKKIEDATIELIKSKLIEENKKDSFKEVEEILQKKRSMPFFLWKMNFIDVFQRDNPGFDVIISNPPYVKDEEIMDMKEALKKSYAVFSGNSDIYTYFYERGLSLLRKNGSLTFISSNKFMRAKYGLNLRNFLKKYCSFEEIIDFGSTHLFDAITNTVIIIFKKENPSVDKQFYFRNNLIDKPLSFLQRNLMDEAWSISNRETGELKEKIEKNGNPLSNLDVKINYGLISGFNEAFVINKKEMTDLIKQSKNNQKIIKPLIRGRDIGRYYHRTKEMYIIVIPSGFTKEMSNVKKLSEAEAKKVIDKEFPGVTNFMENVQKSLEKGEIKAKGRGLYTRDNKGEYWWELRDCTYYNDFKKDKIIWIELSDKNKFSYSNQEEYILAGGFLLTGSNLKFLLSFLNSKLCLFYFNLICNSSGMNTTQWKKFVMDRVPIPKISEKDKEPFIEIVNKILSITDNKDYLENQEKQDLVKSLEKKIDKMVYEIYELTPEEIDTIENFNKN